MKNKYVFIFFWILLLSIPIYTIFKNTNLQIVFTKPALQLNLIQRLSGLIVFTLLPIQITLGAFMTRLAEKFGSWIFWFHITQAILIYVLILVHPITFLFLRKLTGGPFDPFYIFTDYCLLCSTKFELYLTFGRLAFVCLTLGYLAGKFRTIVLLRKHWKKFHYFNYLGFFLISFHAFKVGSDLRTRPFVYYFWAALVWVAGVTICKAIKKLRKN